MRSILLHNNKNILLLYNTRDLLVKDLNIVYTQHPTLAGKADCLGCLNLIKLT
jgi:hypothetical protein